MLIKCCTTKKFYSMRFYWAGKRQKWVGAFLKNSNYRESLLRYPRFQISKALSPTIINMLQDKIKIIVIEHCYGLSQNSKYLVKKSTYAKYRLVNVVVKPNKVTGTDANLPLFTDNFTKEFASCAIFLL